MTRKGPGSGHTGRAKLSRKAEPPATPHKVGRPTKYDAKRHPVIAAALARDGKTDEEMAELIGVNLATLYRWKTRHPDFCEALKGGKVIADDNVERCLYARATGYDNPNAVKIFMPKDAIEPVYAPFVEHYPPDVTAQIFWLKNRRPDKWRDKHDMEHSGNVGMTYIAEIGASGAVSKRVEGTE